MLKRLFSNIRESCTLSGLRTTMFCISRFGPEIAWTFTEKNPFRFLNNSAFSPPGHGILICVQSIVPTTLGNAHILMKSSLIWIAYQQREIEYSSASNEQWPQIRA